jgi:Xaa-Pro dipeptidase
MYWLTGYDTFGFCFFQSLVVKADGSMVLLTRSADLRQARHTSIIDNILVWTDRADANPTVDLRNLLNDLDLLGRAHRRRIRHARPDRLQRPQARRAVADLRADRRRLRHCRPPAAVQEPGRDQKVEKAAALADDALDAALPLIRQGGDEGAILAAMQGAVFAGGGDYPANEFIIGSGADALLCRYKAGRRKLTKNDQLTLEWAGVFHHYHAAMMRTVLTGKVSKRHQELFDAAKRRAAGGRGRDGARQHLWRRVRRACPSMEAHGLTKHRLNACGYSLGARFTPSWMDMPMFYQGNPEPTRERPASGASPTRRSSSRSRKTSAARTSSSSSRPPFRPTTT